MSFDRMGRRVTKNDQRFVYDGYLQVVELSSDPILHSPFSILNSYVWDPTEPVATRPLVWNSSTFQPFNFSTSYYTHDGNKNVSEVVAASGDVAAHYDYATFGAVTTSYGDYAAANPWRFSSEFAEDELNLVYYNYRHYEPVAGRWLSRDLIEERGSSGLYSMCDNYSQLSDVLGLMKKDAMAILRSYGIALPPDSGGVTSGMPYLPGFEMMFLKFVG